MDINFYTREIRKFAIYQGGNTKSLQELMYLSLGAAGEVGEIANKVKKLYRDCDSAEARTKIQNEIGDVFWYLCRLTDALGAEPGQILMDNYNKLEDRLKRDVIHGNGDSR